MNDDQLLRYSRHILLPEIGIEGQQRLLDAHALLIGAGGLGSPAALYLAAAGVGTITLCDGDVVDLTNLQRQIVHREAAIGMRKVESARDTLLSINPRINVQTVAERVSGDALDRLVQAADIVLDGSDNFATRHAVNRACVKSRKPLVSGAGIRFDGQLAVFDLSDAESPCYACLFPEDGENEDVRCAVMGVFAPLVGIIGSMQAAEALKILAGTGDPMTGRLLLLDLLHMDVRTVRLKRDLACPVCAGR
ncbi:MAG: HesA/MoeB/ThiF family protein [Betaproteobacteria bacterium]|jgi:molybdopterin/thiamine biosynthesis adenylyltransferase|nr:HesA/MoeB/ThiF family protein [Betaproteobacteria bacterium]MDH4292668.1 HesA/MoeB/ThiF family protein [Betaproteobacteria bacterium]MDH5342804.1 HesA/MoeB/ThiF family protein [Betaproteobacteria bacterium]